MKKESSVDRKRLLRKSNHLTRPPRLEGAAKNAGLNPTRKKKTKGSAGKDRPKKK